MSTAFIRVARNPGHWDSVATALAQAGVLLWDGELERSRKMTFPLAYRGEMQRSTFEAARLLMALALENAVKGLIIQREPELVSSRLHPDLLSTTFVSILSGRPST